MDRSANVSSAIQNVGNLDILPSSLFKWDVASPLRLKYRLGNVKRNYDYILIDSSPSLNDETLAVMLASDDLLVVTTPDAPTLSTTLKAIKLAKKRGVDVKGLRTLLDQLKNKFDKAVIVLATTQNSMVNLIAGVTKNCTDKFHAGEIISMVAKKIDGKGGGRADMAQGGGSNLYELTNALNLVEKYVQEALE